MVAKDFQSTCKIILQSPPSFPARCLHKMSFVPKFGSQISYSTPVRSRYTPKQRNSPSSSYWHCIRTLKKLVWSNILNVVLKAHSPSYWNSNKRLCHNCVSQNIVIFINMHWSFSL
jgi:hypothetical protein